MLFAPVVGFVVGWFLTPPRRALLVSSVAWLVAMGLTIAVVSNHDRNFWGVVAFSLLATLALTWVGAIARIRRTVARPPSR